jgi:hypothetical protein
LEHIESFTKTILTEKKCLQGRFKPRTSSTPGRPKKMQKKITEIQSNSNSNINDHVNALTNSTPMDLLYEIQQPQAMFGGLQQLQEPAQGVVSNYHWGEVGN